MNTTTTMHNAAGPVGRIVRIVQLHFTNPWTAILLPSIMLAGIFVLNVVIWAIVLETSTDKAEAGEGLQYSGSIFYIFIYMLVVAVQAISITFPFALGYGVTRRDFYLGSSLTFIILSAAYSVILTVASVVEEATGGWGLGGRMFTAVYFGESPIQRLAVFFLAFLFFFFVGAAAASVWVRWRATGLSVFFIGVATLSVVAVAIISLSRSWATVGSFFGAVGILGALVWSLTITAVAGVMGFLILRKAPVRA